MYSEIGILANYATSSRSSLAPAVHTVFFCRSAVFRLVLGWLMQQTMLFSSVPISSLLRHNKRKFNTDRATWCGSKQRSSFVSRLGCSIHSWQWTRQRVARRELLTNRVAQGPSTLSFCKDWDHCLYTRSLALMDTAMHNSSSHRPLWFSFTAPTLRLSIRIRQSETNLPTH
jgi:hypothetical protein